MTYIAFYPVDDCDDKAVHYYSSAAFLNTSTYKKDLIMGMIPQWSGIVGSARMRERLITRLTGSSNYIAANLLIKFLRKWQSRFTPNTMDAVPYSKYIKITFLFMLISAMCYLIFLSRGTALGTWPILLIFNLATLRPVCFPAILPLPLANMDPFMSYVPRGSATLLVLAILLSYATNKKIYFILSCLLLFFWHATLALLVFFILAVALLVDSFTAYLLAKKYVRETKNADSFYYLFFISCLLLFLFIFVRKMYYAMPLWGDIALSLHGGTFLMKEAIHAAILICIVYVFIKSKITDYHTGYRFKFFLVSAVFLIVAQIYSILDKNVSLCNFVKLLIRINLTNEIDMRLSTARYLMEITLIVFILACWWQDNKTRIISARNGYMEKAIVLVCMILSGALFITHTYGVCKIIYTGKTGYFLTDCREAKNMFLEKTGILELNPRDEPTFFYSLGEFLFND